MVSCAGWWYGEEAALGRPSIPAELTLLLLPEDIIIPAPLVGLILLLEFIIPSLLGAEDDEFPYDGDEDPLPEEAEEEDICLRNLARRLLNQTWIRASVNLVRWANSSRV